MTELDFTGIDPRRLPEARRRVAAIQSYLTLSQPRTADAIRIGGSVGLSRWRFVRLVNVWHEHRQARLLVMDRRKDSGPSSSIDPVAAAITDEVIKDLGADTNITTIVELINARCSEAGVKAPAMPTIWRQMRKVQATIIDSASGPPRIVLGRMWFHLPVDGRSFDAGSMALVAVMLPERLIIAHRISCDPDFAPSVGDLVGDVAARQAVGGAARPLLMEAEDRRAAADRLDLVGLGHVQPHRKSVQIEISKAFGGRLEQLRALYRPNCTPAVGKKPKTRQAQPLTDAEAVDAIETAIAANNAATRTTIPPFTIAANEH